MFTEVGFVFTDVGFHLNSGFTKIVCTPICPLPFYCHVYVVGAGERKWDNIIVWLTSELTAGVLQAVSSVDCQAQRLFSSDILLPKKNLGPFGAFLKSASWLKAPL